MEAILMVALGLFVLFLIFMFPGSYIAKSYGHCAGLNSNQCSDVMIGDAVMFWLGVAVLVGVLALIPVFIRKVEQDGNARHAAEAAARLAEERRRADAAEKARMRMEEERARTEDQQRRDADTATIDIFNSDI